LTLEKERLRKQSSRQNNPVRNKMYNKAIKRDKRKSTEYIQHGLFCLEDCFLSLSFSKVKEFSLVSFLALHSFSLSVALNSIFSRTSRFLSLSFALILLSSLINFLAL
jgi:hypothetical protein